MTTTRARSAKPAARSLIGTGVLLLAGVILHPHAPDAHNMAQVAYSQTGETAWWPAHLLLVSNYVLFLRFLVQVSRTDGLPTSTQRVLKVALPIAVICILAMIVHLLLPLGHDSVANSHHGWAFWAKDVVESIDGLWAVCVATVAWTLGRTGAIGGRFTAVLGVAGGIGFALFSILIPLTGVVVSLRFTRLLLPVVPGFAILMVAWAVVTGISVRSDPHPA
jgi:hypothetical protein